MFLPYLGVSVFVCMVVTKMVDQQTSKWKAVASLCTDVACACVCPHQQRFHQALSSTPLSPPPTTNVASPSIPLTSVALVSANNSGQKTEENTVDVVKDSEDLRPLTSLASFSKVDD
ncbi:unnamed protein product, partial [Protopolystoma xenopodis]